MKFHADVVLSDALYSMIGKYDPEPSTTTVVVMNLPETSPSALLLLCSAVPDRT